MKLIFCLSLTLSIAVGLHSQNCQKLDKELFFTSIKFGIQVPKDVANYSKNSKLEYPGYTDYRLAYDSLDHGAKKKYSDLFKFQTIPFSYSLISANKKGQVFLVDLYYFFEDSHGKDSIISKPPANFIKLFNKLVSLYGDPTRTEKSPGSDTLFIKHQGIYQLVVWECNNINLQLRVHYGSRMKELNIVEIQIKNAQFELMEQIELLQ